MSKKIAVIAGTPVDTQMGIDYLNTKIDRFELISCPVSIGPQEQTIFQVSAPDEKYRVIKEMMQKQIDDGVCGFFIYCNSLSSSVDFDRLKKELNTVCITPLDAYKTIARTYNRFGLIAANSQATAKIESTIINENNNATVVALGFLPLVFAIEKAFKCKDGSYGPEEIVDEFMVKDIVRFCKKLGAESFILGCTHFPYIKKVLEREVDIPIIDPADVMYDLLINAI